MQIPATPPVVSPPSQEPARADLRAAAKQLEAVFLAEMLEAAGLGKSRDAFGGGVGEDQFSSFLVQAKAQKLVETGGIGLAESIFQALKDRSDDAR